MEKTDEFYEVSQNDLIATLLFEPKFFDQVLEKVSVEDFSLTPEYLTFKAMVEVSNRNEIISVTSVGGVLQDWGKLETVGGFQYLLDLQRQGELVSISSPVKMLISGVKSGSTRLKVQKVLRDSEDALDPDSGRSVFEAVNSVANQLNSELNEMRHDDNVLRVSDTVESYLDLLAERKKASEERGNGLQGIPTPLKTLNELTSGWCEEQLITVGARTGVGKSIFAVQSAVHAGMSGHSVMFFSLEMSTEELNDRIFSAVTQVSQSRLKTGNITESDKARIQNSSSMIKRMNIEVDGSPDTTVDIIRAKALQKKQSPEGLDFIIVDYLQLLSPTPGKRYHSRQEQVADLSRSMKLLAKQLQVPIMILVQVNRRNQNDTSEDDTPTIDNIRESAAIAQDSNIVILLHRDKNDTTEFLTPKTKVILAKNRNGQSDRTIVCNSLLATSTFLEIKTADDVVEENQEEGSESAESSGKVGVGGNVKTDGNVEINTFSPDSPISVNHQENPPNAYYPETSETLEIPGESQGLSEDGFDLSLSGSDGFDDSDGFNDLDDDLGFNSDSYGNSDRFTDSGIFDDDEDDEIDLSGWGFEDDGVSDSGNVDDLGSSQEWSNGIREQTYADLPEVDDSAPPPQRDYVNAFRGGDGGQDGDNNGFEPTDDLDRENTPIKPYDKMRE